MDMGALTLPEHKCGLTLSHNKHKDFYETATQHLETIDACTSSGPIAEPDLDYATMEDRAAMAATDEVWELHWYPDTPIGFHHFGAPTFERLMERAKEFVG